MMDCILFVDDEPNLLDGMKRYLRNMRREWRTFFVGSGPEAVGILENNQVDVIISDMRMPDMDGVALLNLVMNRYPHVVRIILSGQSDKKEVLKSVVPAHQFLSKPCDSNTLKSTISRALALRAVIGDENLRKLVSKIGALPALPEVYLELVDEIESDSSTAESVGKIVSKDVGVSADLLKTVNSSFFGFTRNISKPEEAVAMLGLDLIKGLVFSSNLMSAFKQRGPATFSVKELWRHSHTVAGLTRRLAQELKLSPKEADEAYLAGLLHDIGKLILAQHLPDQLEEILDQAKAEGRPFHEVEYAVMGSSHAEIGAYLMGLWGFSESVIKGVSLHHRPENEGQNQPSVLTLVHAADCLEHQLTGDCGGSAPPELCLEHLDAVGCLEKMEDWQALCSDLVAQGGMNE